MPAEATDLHFMPLIRLAFAIDMIQRGNLGRACYSQVNLSISLYASGPFTRLSPTWADSSHLQHKTSGISVFSSGAFIPTF